MDSLPELVISRIADYLEPEDITRWSRTCKRLHDLLPSFLIMKGEDFHFHDRNKQAHKQPRTGKVRRGYTWPDEPEPYFEGPPLKGPVKKMFISLTWNDQGWGNQKGDIFLTLMRGSEEIATKYKPLGIAPHKKVTDHTVLTTNEIIIKEAREGDHYKFTRNIGGGGGHQLIVKNYKAIVQYQTRYNE